MRPASPQGLPLWMLPPGGGSGCLQSHTISHWPATQAAGGDVTCVGPLPPPIKNLCKILSIIRAAYLLVEILRHIKRSHRNKNICTSFNSPPVYCYIQASEFGAIIMHKSKAAKM